jgi:hypothetical protein
MDVRRPVGPAPKGENRPSLDIELYDLSGPVDKGDPIDPELLLGLPKKQ